MRILTLNLVNHSIVNIALGGSAVITFAGLPVSKESRARSVVVVFTPDGRIAYEALETVDQIAEMLTGAPASSPTNADIDRRVQLLREAAVFHELPFTTPRDYCTVDGRFYRRRWAESARTEWCETDEATFAAGLRATAIRELLRERGGK